MFEPMTSKELKVYRWMLGIIWRGAIFVATTIVAEVLLGSQIERMLR